jgi:hypothetical protein
MIPSRVSTAWRDIAPSRCFCVQGAKLRRYICDLYVYRGINRRKSCYFSLEMLYKYSLRQRWFKVSSFLATALLLFFFYGFCRCLASNLPRVTSLEQISTDWERDSSTYIPTFLHINLRINILMFPWSLIHMPYLAQVHLTNDGTNKLDLKTGSYNCMTKNYYTLYRFIFVSIELS